MPRRQKRSPLEYHRAFLGGLGFVYALSALLMALAVAWQRGLLADPMADLPALSMLAAPAVAPLFLAAPRVLPLFVKAPSRWYHVPAAIVVVGVLTASGEYPVTLQGLSAGLTPEQMNAFGSTFLPAAGIGLFVAFIVTSIRCVCSGGGEAGELAPTPAEVDAILTARRADPAARGDGSVPQVNGMMRILAVADFAGPRLLGLGLLGAAWMLWDFLSDDRPERVSDLALGLPPMQALGLYAGFGVALTLPFLLTPWIGRPRYFAGGLAKAALLAAATWLLQEPLRLAISGALSDLHRPLALSVAPPVFLTLAAVTILSAPVLAFFRQLGTIPSATPADEAGPVMDAATLRDLRLARMQV